MWEKISGTLSLLVGTFRFGLKRSRIKYLSILIQNCLWAIELPMMYPRRRFFFSSSKYSRCKIYMKCQIILIIQKHVCGDSLANKTWNWWPYTKIQKLVTPNRQKMLYNRAKQRKSRENQLAIKLKIGEMFRNISSF